MYMKLLEQTIKELKGEELEDEIRANVNLRVDLRIDETYIPDMNQRLTVYRRMAGVRSEDELRRADGGNARPLRPAAHRRSRIWPNMPSSACWRTASGRIHRPGRATRRLKVQAGGETRPGLAFQDRSGTQGRPTDSAGDA